RRQVALLLLLIPPGHDRRAEHLQAAARDLARRARPRHLFIKDDLLDNARAAAAVFLRPVDAGPSPLEQLPLPLPEEGFFLGATFRRPVGFPIPVRRQVL